MNFPWFSLSLKVTRILGWILCWYINSYMYVFMTMWSFPAFRSFTYIQSSKQSCWQWCASCPRLQLQKNWSLTKVTKFTSLIQATENHKQSFSSTKTAGWNWPSIIWSSVQNQLQSVRFCMLWPSGPKYYWRHIFQAQKGRLDVWSKHQTCMPCPPISSSYVFWNVEVIRLEPGHHQCYETLLRDLEDSRMC